MGKIYKLIERYLSNIFQRFVSNGQTSPWRQILAGVPQGSILGHVLFFIYVDDIPDRLKSNIKLFENNTSIFSIVKNKNHCARDLTHDLSLISKRAFEWKMLFNPDPTKRE